MTNIYKASRFLSSANMPEWASLLSNATIEGALTKRIPDICDIRIVVCQDAIGLGIMVPKHVILNGTGDGSEFVLLEAACPRPLDETGLLNAIDQFDQEIKKHRSILGVIGTI